MLLIRPGVGAAVALLAKTAAVTTAVTRILNESKQRTCKSQVDGVSRC